MTDKELEQIDNYLNGALAGQILHSFEERLAQDKAFYAVVLAQQHINEVLEDKHLLEFMQILQDVETAYKAKNAIITYTLDELLSMFAKVDDYEEELTVIYRSVNNRVSLAEPQNGIDVSLQKSISENIKLVIENSEEDKIGNYIFPANTKKLNVDTQDFLPGRYYWKLISTQKSFHTIWGFFFVRKDLMPQQLQE